MDIVEITDLTEKESRAEVKFADGDDPFSYPTCFNFSFAKIVNHARNLPPSKKGKTSTAHLDGYTGLSSVSNYDEIMGGYQKWAVPTSTADNMVFRRMQTQMMYGQGLGRITDPYEQVQRMFAAPLERKLQKYSQGDEFKKGSSQLYVLLIKLHRSNSNPEGDSWEPPSSVSYSDDDDDDDDSDGSDDDNAPKNPKVWRLVVCHADTNLDSFHDQIIGPAMGWRRHYHGYMFTVPTSGATFGPQNSDAIDMMHWGSGYTADSEKYDLRHVLRKPGQKLHYTYDLGDAWRHEVILIGREDRGTIISADYVKKYKYVYDDIDRSSEWTLEGNALLAGMINCPPEDSNGCDEMGNYGSILKKGTNFVPHEFGANWNEHKIFNAYVFDLQAHQKRLKKAVKERKNYQDGCLQYVYSMSPTGTNDSEINFRGNLHGKGRKLSGQGPQQEVVGKKTTSNKCANCHKQKQSNAGLKLFACSRCKAVKYCGRECQREHWKRGHREKCKPVL